MKLLLPILELLTLFLISSCGAADLQAQPVANSPICTNLTNVPGAVIELGTEIINEHGYTRSFTTINSDGQVVVNVPQRNIAGIFNGQIIIGPPIWTPVLQPRFGHISPLTVQTIIRLASAEDFWKMKNNASPSATSSTEYVSINLSCASHRVSVSHGGESNQQFNEMYSLLVDLEPR